MWFRWIDISLVLFLSFSLICYQMGDIGCKDLFYILMFRRCLSVGICRFSYRTRSLFFGWWLRWLGISYMNGWHKRIIWGEWVRVWDYVEVCLLISSQRYKNISIKVLFCRRKCSHCQKIFYKSDLFPILKLYKALVRIPQGLCAAMVDALRQTAVGWWGGCLGV